MELGLLLRPVGLGGEDAVQELLGDGLSPPLLGGNPGRVHQRLPLILQ